MHTHTADLATLSVSNDDLHWKGRHCKHCRNLLGYFQFPLPSIFACPPPFPLSLPPSPYLGRPAFLAVHVSPQAKVLQIYRLLLHLLREGQQLLRGWGLEQGTLSFTHPGSQTIAPKFKFSFKSTRPFFHTAQGQSGRRIRNSLHLLTGTCEALGCKGTRLEGVSART